MASVCWAGSSSCCSRIPLASENGGTNKVQEGLNEKCKNSVCPNHQAILAWPCSPFHHLVHLRLHHIPRQFPLYCTTSRPPLIWVVKFGLYSSTVVNKCVILVVRLPQPTDGREQCHRRVYCSEPSVRLERDHQVRIVIKFASGQLVEGILDSLFYMPGTLGGAFVVDYLGPKYTMVDPFSVGVVRRHVDDFNFRLLVSYARQ
jgi:hypothetical protein